MCLTKKADKYRTPPWILRWVWMFGTHARVPCHQQHRYFISFAWRSPSSSTLYIHIRKMYDPYLFNVNRTGLQPTHLPFSPHFEWIIQCVLDSNTVYTSQIYRCGEQHPVWVQQKHFQSLRSTASLRKKRPNCLEAIWSRYYLKTRRNIKPKWISCVEQERNITITWPEAKPTEQQQRQNLPLLELLLPFTTATTIWLLLLLLLLLVLLLLLLRTTATTLQRGFNLLDMARTVVPHKMRCSSSNEKALIRFAQVV